jgi:hypothetical protein
MAKNDVVVRSAADLERKYNFAALLGLKKNVEITAQGMQKLENELNLMLNALVINLKDVLDDQSEVSLWFYSGVPTTKNEPYTLWSNPNDHIGDIYYDKNSGYVYQYNGVWEVNTHPDLIEAMAITNSETDTSEDHERKVFLSTPTVPYSNGDWWIKEDGSLFICQISKNSGTYETMDFIDSSNYVESVVEKIGEEIKVLKGTITIISENYAKFTDLATGGSTVISGDNIVTGTIKSQNYIANKSGTKLSLEDGVIDSKNFKVDSSGNMTCNDATINGSAMFNGDGFSVSKDGVLKCKGAEMNDIDINGGEIQLFGSTNSASIQVISESDGEASQAQMGYFGFNMWRNDKNVGSLTSGASGGVPRAYLDLYGAYSRISLWPNLSEDVESQRASIYMSAGSGEIDCVTLNQTSLEERKKNIEKLENGLDIINSTEIYKYNFKNEEDTTKKHIGFVIGENYKYSKDITSNENDGVDIYSMVSVCFKAIQEQQAQIEELKNQIKGGKE